MLQQIIHPHDLADVSGRDVEADLVEAWRSEADARVAREAETLARDAHELVEPTIAILVMDDGERVGSLGDAAEADAARLGRADRALQRGRIAFTVWEVRRIAGQAQPQ